MKIKKFAAYIVVTLLNNLLHIWQLTAVLDRQFHTFLQSIFRDSSDNNEMDDEAVERDPDVEEEPMELDDENESTTDDEAVTDSDDSIDQYINDLWERQPYHAHSANYDSQFPRETLGGLAKAKQTEYYNQNKLPPYSFKPLKLSKCDYKRHNGWREYPLARSGHRVTATENYLYSLGGYNPNPRGHNEDRLFQELWQYNFATMKWKLILSNTFGTNMPSELASNALAIANNVLISYGGTGIPFGESCSNDCYFFTTGDTPRVERLETGGVLPLPQYGPAVVIHEHYLYTIGGTTGFDYSCDVFRLDFKTKLWECIYVCRTDIRDDPEGRYRHEVVYDGKHIFVLGGGTTNLVYDLQKLPAFNLKTNKWDFFETLPDPSFETPGSGTRYNNGFPKPRKCFSCVQHKNAHGDIEAFITGGLQGELVYFADIWRINFTTRRWTRIKIASLPKPLFFHAAAHSNNGCMYIFGGIEYDVKRKRRCNDLYKMWMTIPKLSEICWEAILYYNKKLPKMDQSRLLKAGIPLSFVQRLR